MAESLLITIRLDEATGNALKLLADKQNSTPGIFAKQLLAAAINSALADPPAADQPPSAAEIEAAVARLPSNPQPTSSDETDQKICTLLSELVTAVTTDGNTTRAEVAALRRDLAELARMLEEAESHDSSPAAGDPIRAETQDDEADEIAAVRRNLAGLIGSVQEIASLHSQSSDGQATDEVAAFQRQLIEVDRGLAEREAEVRSESKPRETSPEEEHTGLIEFDDE